MMIKDIVTEFVRSSTLLANESLEKSQRKILTHLDFTDALNIMGLNELIPESKFIATTPKKRGAATFKEMISDPKKYDEMLAEQKKLFQRAREAEQINSLSRSQLKGEQLNLFNPDEPILNAVYESSNSSDIDFDDIETTKTGDNSEIKPKAFKINY